MKAIIDNAVRYGYTRADNESEDDFCLRIVRARLPWPARMTNDEAWRLIFAGLHDEISARRAEWIESEQALKLRLVTARGEISTSRPRPPREVPFGRVVMSMVEELRREAIALEDAWRERQHEVSQKWADRAPDLMEPLVGFRSWNVSENKLRARGYGVDSWRGSEEVRAVCERHSNAPEFQREPHAVCDPRCECGLYAYNKLESCDWRAGVVTGAVAARGRVQVHREGFRAEFARPVLFAYDAESRGRVERLGSALGVEVVPRERLEVEARRFGRLVAEDLLPEDTTNEEQVE